jgi:hypothetical protein
VDVSEITGINSFREWRNHEKKKGITDFSDRSEKKQRSGGYFPQGTYLLTSGQRIGGLSPGGPAFLPAFLSHSGSTASQSDFILIKTRNLL